MDPKTDPREAALAALDRRALTRRELAGKLRLKGFDEDAVAATLDRLAAVGLVDDRALAYNLARRFAEDGRRGAARVSADLARRGVPRELAAEAVAAAFTPEASRDAVDRATARLVRGGAPQDRREREKLYRRLRRAGFSSAEALAALERAGAPADELPPPGEDEDDAFERRETDLP